MVHAILAFLRASPYRRGCRVLHPSSPAEAVGDNGRSTSECRSECQACWHPARSVTGQTSLRIGRLPFLSLPCPLSLSPTAQNLSARRLIFPTRATSARTAQHNSTLSHSKRRSHHSLKRTIAFGRLGWCSGARTWLQPHNCIFTVACGSGGTRTQRARLMTDCNGGETPPPKFYFVYRPTYIPSPTAPHCGANVCNGSSPSTNSTRSRRYQRREQGYLVAPTR